MVIATSMSSIHGLSIPMSSRAPPYGNFNKDGVPTIFVAVQRSNLGFLSTCMVLHWHFFAPLNSHGVSYLRKSSDVDGTRDEA